MAKNLLKQVMIKQEKTNVGAGSKVPVEGLVEAIESGYIKNIKSKFQKKKTFAPSTLTWNHGECARYWYLAFDGAIFKDDATPFGVANRTNGVLSHDRIQDAILAAGILDDSMEFDKDPSNFKEQKHPALEFTIKHDDPPIFGYGDAMLKYNGTTILGEIKTAPSEGFEYRKMHQKPKTGHLMQLLLYMKILKKDNGAIIYENKNNHEILVLPITFTEHYRRWVDQAFDWMREVRKSWEKQELPQKLYRSNSKICKSCPIREACAEADAGVTKIEHLELLVDEVL